MDERMCCSEAAPDGPVYTVPEVAALLRVHKSTVYRDVESGRIDAYRVGKGRGTVRITDAALREYRRRAVTRPEARAAELDEAAAFASATETAVA